MKRYEFVKPEIKYKQLVEAIETAVGRELTEHEHRTIKWISECEYTTSGVILDLFKEVKSC